MRTIGEIIYKEIQRISPSQYISLRNCPYKSLLAEAMDNKPLLPFSANAYYGIVLHKLLEQISKREIRNEEEFNKSFMVEVRSVEDKLIDLSYNFLVPLQKKVKDFTMKKILLKEHMQNVYEKSTSPSSVKFYSENWYESNDKLIGGKIDLVIDENGYIRIIDFKTGAISEGVLDDYGEVYIDVKEEYKEQLKLYAYLYFEKTGKYPDELSLVDLMKQKYIIEFTEDDCKSIAIDAKKLLKDANNSIECKKFEAKPSEVNCKYCLYRPACSYYLNYLSETFSTNDVVGTILRVEQFQNGSITICLM
ncbi:MAG: PD-(D/E)XK nuclease family protein, partial [Ignavibacteriota bacterium]